VRSIEVTDDEVRVGESSVARADIAGIRPGRGDDVPLLGRRTGEGVPRGTMPLTLQLLDGSAIAIASRFPQRLAAALGAEEAVLEVRPAEEADLAELPEIDRRAEALFRVAGIDLPEIPYPVDELHESKAVLVVGRPAVGFVQIDEVDGLAHIQEIAVLPSHMRRGLGSLLLDAACSWARSAGYAAVTLTTYAEVPWNAPFYAARGFVELASLTPELAELRDWERDIGLDAVGRRIAMRRDL
jgi:ribosomal protein S18 acetylase RimI-like enzyme